MNTVHNARIQLLATALNNLALAVIIAGFVAPAVTGQLSGGWHVPGDDRLGRVRNHPTYRRPARAREAAADMTWDQAVVWLIVPGIVAIVLAAGGVWLSRYIP